MQRPYGIQLRLYLNSDVKSPYNRYLLAKKALAFWDSRGRLSSTEYSVPQQYLKDGIVMFTWEQSRKNAPQC